jgi:broad specificity phosphatase PhoE
MIRTPDCPSIAGDEIRRAILARVSEVVQRFDWVASTTITGSFLLGNGLEGISDIDCVVIVDELNRSRFAALHNAFETTLGNELARYDYRLQINPTLGPLKFNEPKLAVLHLMLYSIDAHVDHVIKSPFTCLDWQRSEVVFKRPMHDVYPVFGLQPRHFVSARRSIQDYLRDYRKSVVSFRELICEESGYKEAGREKPMTVRDRHEFAYHIVRFLMVNSLKLVRRVNEVGGPEELLRQFLAVFGLERELVGPLFAELRDRKQRIDFDPPMENLDQRLEAFVTRFEAAFRRTFFDDAARHYVMRHAPTRWNAPVGHPRFQGRSDVPSEPIHEKDLAHALKLLEGERISRVLSSPLVRARQTLEAVAAVHPLPPIECDDRWLEIDYGGCEGLDTSQAQHKFPRLFEAWREGEDVKFPNGENTHDVLRRASSATAHYWIASGNTLTCTHNVVLRCLVGKALGVPMEKWHLLKIPHLRPLLFRQTRSFGWFLDLEEDLEREIFSNFVLSNHHQVAKAA